MALVTKNFTLNVTPGAMPPTIHVSEYDIGRTYTITILDENGSAFEIPTGTTAAVEGTLNGTYGFTTSATISGNQISFALTESMTAYAGNAWCKIKLTLNSEPIQTCAFILAVDRAGVEAATVIGVPGFQEQINEGIAEYFDNDPPFFELPSGGQSGQALLSDGSNGAYWGQAQSGGTGLSDDAKAALLACFRNVAWIGSDGQSYYDDLYDALYPPAPPATLLSISAAFNQGSHVVYNTDSLDSLKPYLTVTAFYSNGTSQSVTAYTLSGTLSEGTSVITVSYGGKTTTFNVTVTAAPLSDVIYVAGAVAKDTNPAGCYAIAVAARARMEEPIENDGYVFTVTDSTKYALCAQDITSLQYTTRPTVGKVYPAGTKTAAWVDSDSVSTAYVWLMLKKNDGTEFTDEELANGAAAVVTVTQGT